MDIGMLIFCLFWSVFLWESEGATGHRHPKTSSLHLPPPEVEEGATLPPELWFTQFLDHFNPTDSRTWKQKYFVNDSFYETGGPIFLMIGGEGPASVNWMVNGSWITYGSKYSALLIQLEHRFYGKSHPTPDLGVESLRYLSSEQALADLAYFITKFKEDRNLTSSKVIAFGGSYPGSLAVWFRLKYPHLVHASVSSSAPLVAQINFKEYLDVVTASLQIKGSEECVQQVSKATQYVYLLLQHRVGWITLKKMFRLCSPLDGLNTMDVSNLFELLAESFEDVVQYNEDNRAFEGVKGTNVTINTLCGIMTDNTLGNPLERYASVNLLRLNITEEKCLDQSYKSMINELRESEWSNETSPGGRQWMYQTCTEFGFYQTSDSLNQPFGKNFSLNFFLQQCLDIFGENFTYEMLRRGVERTNIMYGGKNPKVSRVVLVNGSIDPWHYLGVIHDLSADTPAIFINGTAHCANMYPEAPTDPPQLTEARTEIENLIGKWLMEE